MKDRDEGSFWDHLEELRKRLFFILVTVAVLTAVAFTFSARLVELVTETSPEPLAALAPAEALTAHLRLSVTAGIIAGSPVILASVWRFVAPGLYRKERRSVIKVTVSGGFLFLAGSAFAWFVIRQPALSLFSSFQTGNITGFWSISSYMEFIGMLLLVFGTAFQLPLAVLFLVRTGIVEPSDLAAYRRHVLVGLLVISAILTPPDALTQVSLTIPLYLLFEVSLLLSRIRPGRRSE